MCTVSLEKIKCPHCTGLLRQRFANASREGCGINKLRKQIELAIAGNSEVLAPSRCQLTAVLNAYPLNEILELYSSICFLRGLLETLMKDVLTRTEDDDLWQDILLSAGLPVCCNPGKSAITKCLVKIWASVMVNAPASRLFSGYFLHAVKDIWINRKLPPAKEDDGTGRAAMSSTNSASTPSSGDETTHPSCHPEDGTQEGPLRVIYVALFQSPYL
ncbi:hypothetical protein B0H14DRAFT_3451567 [Mycena olivaceomarginata]|nr:hypothetical protein B0H14DRAFT_3451567 [Mycena olivaceomarginata]